MSQREYFADQEKIEQEGFPIRLSIYLQSGSSRSAETPRKSEASRAAEASAASDMKHALGETDWLGQLLDMDSSEVS